MSEEITKQHWIGGFIVAFLLLIFYGILDNQDKEITHKNRVTLSVRASNDQLRFDLCFAENRDYLNADLNHFCRGLNEKS